MAAVTYNPQSFAVDGRRIRLAGASLHYARIHPAEWASRIADVAQAGFNTVETACPWSLHEPRRGRYHFQDEADVAGFVRLCDAEGLRVVVRLGPYIGSGYEGGGLPPWLSETEDVVLRQANEPYLERVGKYLRKLIGELGPLQVTTDGPIVLVQGEHTWNCSNPEQMEKYLGEVTRMIRENGIGVPITNANDLWTDLPGTIDTWRGREDMLSSVRQLRSVQPDAPRVVSAFAPTATVAWGDPAPDDPPPDTLVRRLAEILAAGGQPIVAPFHAGTSFGFSGGTVPGIPGASVATCPAPGAPLGESGERTDAYRALRRLVAFAGQFEHVFADLDPDYQPITLAPAADGRSRSRSFSIVPLRGGQGRIVFVFANGTARDTTLLLDNGVRMPIDLGDQSVGWYLLDADLQGRGRLDYVNLCPLAIIDRSLVVLRGAKDAPVYLSVEGSTLQEKVPAGRTPLVVEHRGVNFVICNQQQADAAYWDEKRLYVGASGLDADGGPRHAPGFTRITVVRGDGETETKKLRSAGRGKRSGPSIGTWRASPAGEQVEGTSPRFATLDGPRTLPGCGAPTGYGWYRVQFKVKSTGKRLVHLPGAADRAHLFLDGEPLALVGHGPGATPAPLEVRLTKGEHVLTALLDNLGRLGDGCEQNGRKGLFDHLYVVKPLKAIKPKIGQGDPIDPFGAAGFVCGLARGQLSAIEQVTWSFTHARKAPLLLDVDGALLAGTFVLNDEPIARYAGATGPGLMRLMLSARHQEAFKRGRNVLRFAPDPHQEATTEELVRLSTLYECVETLTEPASWSFAKWEPGADSKFQEPSSRTAARNLRGRPCWWKATFPPAGADPGPVRVDCSGLSKGQLFVNGHNVGRYFTARADGHAAGPQTSLYVPGAWLAADEDNELLIFDEHGFDPGKVAIEA